MRNNTKIRLSFVVCFLILNFKLFSQDVDKAKDLFDHGFEQEATRQLLDILHETSNDSIKAEALFHLGYFSYLKKSYRTASKDWNRLVREYPDSRYSKIVGRLYQSVLLRIEQIENDLKAKEWFSNGDFWSGATTEDPYGDIFVFYIKNNYRDIDKVSLAVNWYDKVIAEYDNSFFQEYAYYKKLITYLGWEETDPNIPLINSKRQFGMKNTREYQTAFGAFMTTLQEFESKYPKSHYLEMIWLKMALHHLEQNRKINAKQYLQKILDKSGDELSLWNEAIKALVNSL